MAIPEIFTELTIDKIETIIDKIVSEKSIELDNRGSKKIENTGYENKHLFYKGGYMGNRIDLPEEYIYAGKINSIMASEPFVTPFSIPTGRNFNISVYVTDANGKPQTYEVKGETNTDYNVKYDSKLFLLNCEQPVAGGGGKTQSPQIPKKKKAYQKYINSIYTY